MQTIVAQEPVLCIFSAEVARCPMIVRHLWQALSATRLPSKYVDHQSSCTSVHCKRHLAVQTPHVRPFAVKSSVASEQVMVSKRLTHRPPTTLPTSPFRQSGSPTSSFRCRFVASWPKQLSPTGWTEFPTNHSKGITSSKGLACNQNCQISSSLSFTSSATFINTPAPACKRDWRSSRPIGDAKAHETIGFAGSALMWCPNKQGVGQSAWYFFKYINMRRTTAVSLAEQPT